MVEHIAFPFDGQTFWCPVNSHLHETLKNEGIYRPEIVQYLQNTLTGGMTFVDVGACYGYYTIVAAKRVKEVVAFEPDERYLPTLRKNVEKYSNVLVHPLAVNSARRMGGLDVSVFKEGPGQICAVTLDSMGLSPDVIKIHVEGAVYNVLLGAHKTIEVFRPTLIVAIHHTLMRRYFGHKSQEVRSYLEDMDYDIVVHEPNIWIAEAIK